MSNHNDHEEAVMGIWDLNRALDQLLFDAPHEFTALLLIGKCDYTVADAAEMMGVDRSTMHRRYQRGLTLLRERTGGPDGF